MCLLEKIQIKPLDYNKFSFRLKSQAKQFHCRPSSNQTANCKLRTINDPLSSRLMNR